MARIKNPETRDNILLAARELFSQNGYHPTSVSDIIKAVGMSQGSFYNYFKNKHEIFREILSNFTDRVVATAESFPVSEIKNTVDYVGVVYQMSQSLISLFYENESLTRIFFWEAVGVHSELDSIIDKTYIRVTDYCQTYLEKGQELGIVRREVNTQMVAAATIGMCTHLINRSLRGDFGEVEPNIIVQTILDVQLNGILEKDQDVKL